jgi:hypothetical protein
VCHIYTLLIDEENDQQRHRTAGHELRHCRDGYFHGRDVGVDIPASSARLFKITPR